jgi:RNA recognition motif-containing protein
MDLYVGNLSYEARDSDLQAAFAPFGQVSGVRMITDRDSGRSKGFAFVEMPNPQEAEAAILGLNGKPLLGRTITVNQARPRDTNGQGGRSPRRW